VVEFPVYLQVGPLALHPHWLFEMLAYLVGVRLYVALKARGGDPLPAEQRWWIVAAAMVGAALGSKLLAWVAEPGPTVAPAALALVLGGKSVVGGLVGGLLAVEGMKRHLGVTRSTGDVFAIPLAVGIGIGRIGCFLTGLDDHTHGLPTGLPWAVDYGDGIPRHPAQLYEIAFVWLLAFGLATYARFPRREGDLFKAFLVAYLSFRLALEFFKPGVAVGGLNAIQWVCLAALLGYAWPLPRAAWRKARVPSG
jgi:phosphatidylglycerol---prolipoprotein diacylglyceryl transferase